MSTSLPQERPANHGKPWEDRDLLLIIETVGTTVNVRKWAAHFERTEASITLVYRWAYSSKAHLDAWIENGLTGLGPRVWRLANEAGLVCQGCP